MLIFIMYALLVKLLQLEEISNRGPSAWLSIEIHE